MEKVTLWLIAECDGKLKNEVKNVLKFSNGKFEVESFKKAFEKLFWENYSFTSFVLMKLFHFHFSCLIDGSLSGSYGEEREVKCRKVLVEKIMKIGLLWAHKKGIQVVINFPF